MQVYTPSTTVDWETLVETSVRIQIHNLRRPDIVLPFRGAVWISLRFNLRRPKSTPKSVLWPTTSRADVDNLAKGLLDACESAGVFVNDRLVIALSTCKFFADADHPEGVEVDLSGVL